MKFLKTNLFALLIFINSLAFSQTITSVAGLGTGELPIPGDSILVDSIIPDGNLAVMSKLYYPYALSLNPNGSVIVGENFSYMIRLVGIDGHINTVAGTGKRGFSNDGGPANKADMDFPAAIARDAQGDFYIADWGNHRIRKINSKGIITTIAGNGNAGYSGDGGLATAAEINSPSGIALDVNGNIYFTEFNNHVLRKIDNQGIISTVAGNGQSGCSADPGTVSSCKLSFPHGVTIDLSGNIYIVDAGNHKIRRISSTGSICTIAGKGTAGFTGDGGQAQAAELSWPHGVAVDNSGNIYITDMNNHRIRKVDVNGVITTFAGTGNRGFSGDNGSPLQAEIGGPIGIAVDGSGAVYFTDTFNHRIRVIK
jgi:sugar lactone lactonase YvrE